MPTQFDIINRDIVIQPEIIDLVVEGDMNSKTITFNLQNRFFDGVDLSSKRIQIAYRNALGETDYDDATLNTLDIDSFTFDWLVSEGVAVESGEVLISVEFSETNISEEKIYIWRTKPKSFNVESSFKVLGNVAPLDYTAQQLFYSSNDNNTFSYISDTNEAVLIDNRRILMPIFEDIVVSGDNRSQIISFTLPRYFDNIDLTSKVIAIKFINAKGQGDRSSATNVTTTDTTITFGWLIDSKVTVKDGFVQFAIEFLGYEDGKFYVWSTIPAQIEVSKGLEVDSLMEEPDPSWIQSWEMRESEIQANDSIRTTNETERISNEDTRIQQETARESNEDIRQSNETTRELNETTRIQNENLRQSTVEAIETTYAPRLTGVEFGLEQISIDFDNVVANVTVDSELILSRGEHDTLQNRLDANDEDFNSKVDFAIVDSKTGESVQTTVADDFKVDITKIEGATTVIPANPDLDISPDNVATITSAKNFDVVACGKNLLQLKDGVYEEAGITVNIFNGEVSVAGTAAQNSLVIIPIAPLFLNGVYTLSANNTVATPTSYDLIRLQEGLEVPLNTLNSYKTFTLSKTTIGSITIRTNKNSAVNYKIKLQLELGSTATSYEPYKSNKITISYETGSLENGVKDTIEYIGNGKGRLTQRVGNMVLDGSEDEGWLKSSITDVDRFFISRVNDYMKISSQIICTHFTQKAHGVQNNSIFNDGTNHLVFNFSDYGTTTLGQWKTFLQSNPVTVLYELETPIITEIDLPPLTSYKGVTNVYTTANPQPKLTVDFKSRLKNTTEILLAEIAKLKQAIISLGGTI